MSFHSRESKGDEHFNRSTACLDEFCRFTADEAMVMSTVVVVQHTLTSGIHSQQMKQR